MQLAQAVLSGIQIGLIYALVAVGLTIIWGLMGMINFAHGELMMWGMFAAWSLAYFLKLDPIVTLVPIGLAAYLVGAAIYRLLMARVQRGEIFTQIFATFGLLLFMQNLANAAFTSDYHFLSNTFLATLFGGRLRVGPMVFGAPQLAGGVIALICFLLLYLLIERTEIGLALRATSEDPEAAALMGINATRMYTLAWGIGAALAAVSGVIVANFFAIFPQVGLPFTLLAYATVALGGFGHRPVPSPRLQRCVRLRIVSLPGPVPAPGAVRALLVSTRRTPRGRRWGGLLGLAGVIIAVGYPLPFQWSGVIYFQTVGFLVLLYSALGIAWNIIGGWCGQFDFGPMVFFGAGAYAMGAAVKFLGFNPWAGFAAAMLFTVAFSALVTFPITRLRDHYFAIATNAIWLIALPIATNWDLIGGSQGLFIPLGRPEGLLAQLARVLAYFALVLLIAGRLEHTKLGYCFKAIRDDEEGAQSLGIHTRVYKVIARCFTAGIYAVGGAIFGMWALSVFPDQVFDINWGIVPTIAVVLGGIGRLWGPVVGCLILVPLSQLISTYLGTGPLAGRGIDLVVYGLLIMIVAAARPQGLLSLPWRRWLGGDPTARAASPAEPP
ncbi:MAG: hypothetical protein E6H04_11600 [Bacillati bacterium ANGP1]|uniref:Branched-chain amino acid ABC transporter permease n=1 Tax=Candidatus Segetimicrobium genomatis TaxID=2569760 RepID=A0A537J5W8_9BACT|nr:MAG: hypothetical protein E6H04_11600 [Terrabacteria group bacterium ANGP1]